MLDADLARIYHVKTKELNKAVKRNPGRFPADFAFQLTDVETRSLRFQSGTSKEGRGGRRYLPYAFTEQGVAMLSGVLKSLKAIRINVAIIRVFVRLRGALAIQKAVIQKLSMLERKIQGHDDQLAILAEAIEELELAPEDSPKRIGFQP